MEHRHGAFRRVLVAGLPMGFGTDAGVFAHGDNAREFALRVQQGQNELQAIVSATSVSARIMGWEDRVGSIDSGKYADVIAVSGDPLEDITELERVRWVARRGPTVWA